MVPLRTANFANHVVELLLDQVDDLAVFLFDANDLVFGLEPPVTVGRHLRNDLGDNRVAVFRAKRRADPLERQVKLLVEHVLEILGAQVRRMRVEGLRQARQVDLQELAGVDLVGLAVAIAIADRPLAHRFGVVDVVDHLQGEQVELDLLAQPLVGLGRVTG